MATYVVGDVQGCYQTLRALLSAAKFSDGDRLWLVGDLVNRGPRSLEVLRYVSGLGERATVVLGNHDVHLLGRALNVYGAKRRDTLDEVLVAPDRRILIDWLRRRPLLYREGDWLMVHAGLLPRWSTAEAESEARRLEAVLAGPDAVSLLGDKRSESLAALTRLRMLRDSDGGPADYDGSPADAPKGLVPWFSAPQRRSLDVTVLFGHWSQLGLHRGAHEIGLDTGCVWGGSLTALRLDDGALFSEPARESPAAL